MQMYIQTCEITVCFHFIQCQCGFGTISSLRLQDCKIVRICMLLVTHILSHVITARKRSLRRLCFYTRLSVCPQGSCLLWGVVPGPGGCLLGGGVWSRGYLLRGGCLVETPPTAIATGGVHPTGMHSCFRMQWLVWIFAYSSNDVTSQFYLGIFPF